MEAENPFYTLDLHHHVGAMRAMAGKSGAASEPMTPETDAAIRTGYMDRHGISQCLLMPGEYPGDGSGKSIAQINTDLRTYRELNSERFPAQVGTTNPRDLAESLEEVSRCVEELQVRGFVWHHQFFGAFINDPSMFAIVEKIETYGLPVFIHIIDGTFLESPWRLEELADSFPGTTFVALDGFSSPDRAMWMPYLAERHPNLLFDTAVATSGSHMIPQFVERVGAGRLLFGSDFYSTPKHFENPFVLYELLQGDLDQSEIAAILGQNARALLGLDA